jgi:hypothetical protein
MASSDGVPPRRTHDPNSGEIRPNRVKHLLAAGGTAFIAAGELNWTGDRSARRSVSRVTPFVRSDAALPFSHGGGAALDHVARLFARAWSHSVPAGGGHPASGWESAGCWLLLLGTGHSSADHAHTQCRHQRHLPHPAPLLSANPNHLRRLLLSALRSTRQHRCAWAFQLRRRLAGGT